MSMSFDPPSRPGPAAADPPGSEAPGPTAPGTQPPGTDTPGPDTPGTQPPGTDARSPAEQRPRGRWTVAGVVGTGVGLLPHVLHHVGLLAGTALIAGLGGTLLFGVLGLVATVPMLIHLRRRFASWWAPTIALVVFAAMFSLSAFVIGPALRHAMSGSGGGGTPTPSMDPNMHNQHHHMNMN